MVHSIVGVKFCRGCLDVTDGVVPPMVQLVDHVKSSISKSKGISLFSEL